jgi:hypothetical protein
MSAYKIQPAGELPRRKHTTVLNVLCTDVLQNITDVIWRERAVLFSGKYSITSV